MGKQSYGVHVVVDRDYSERLRCLPAGEPVWIIDSEANHPIVVALWQERDAGGHANGITSFKCTLGATPEDSFIAELRTIDLHHGQYSHDPPYSWLNVIGIPWSERIQKTLNEFGPFKHESTAEGFIARRSIAESCPPEE